MWFARILALTAALAAVPSSLAKADDAAARLGRVDFPVSCGADTQASFNRAVATLHNFWYKEAIASFSRITEANPRCAMAYWGIAMSYWNQLWAPPREAALDAGWAAVQKARAVGAPTGRERDFIEA